MQGKYVEGFLVQEKAILRLDTTDIRRLEYFAVNYKYIGEKELSDQCYDKVIEICNGRNEKKYILKKIECLIGKRDLLKAKKTLRDLDEKYKDNDYKMLLSEFDTIVDQAIYIDDLMEKCFRKY